MDPGLSAATFRHRRDARILLAFIRGGVTCTRLSESDEEAGSTDRASARQGGKQGEVGRRPGAGCNGLVEVCNGLQDGPELSAERLDEERMRGANALIGREWRRGLDSMDAFLNNVGIAHMMGVEETLQRSAARQLSGFEGWPWGEKVTKERGVFVLKPVQDVRAGVFQRPGAAGGGAHCVADPTATMCDKWLKRTQRGALGGEGLEFVAMLQQELKLQCSVRGGVLRMAGREGFAVFGQGAGIDREQDEECLFTPGVDERTFVEFKAHRDGAAGEPLLEGTCPRVDGLWLVVELTALAGGRANGWYADIVFGISPIKAHEGRKFFLW